jgi:uncharacterized protein YyaL (SSP411 family)
MSAQHTANRLATETSPYLLQHAYNPVDWYPWGPEALEKARKERKLLLISVGYSACHWCHVMERESFEDEQIAQIMNAHFVCIKVDREERPDIDQIYMDAVQLMTGRGGWPLNCFALPDGRPLYGGTYFPPKQWVSVLHTLSQQWREQPDKALTYAERLTEAIQAMEDLAPAETDDLPGLRDDLARIWLEWRQRMDFAEGGEDRAPKFPMPVNWTFLLRYGHLLGNAELLDHVHFTLRKMAYGGIYDAVGGGFARYSTDRFWHIPHYEKMLYDNGQLVVLFAEAWQQRKDPLYLKVITETLEWVAREMTHPQGGFYSALDADSEGEEGKFYVWQLAELRQLLGTLSPLYEVAYNMTEAGNWEHGKNTQLRTLSDSELAERFGRSPEQVAQELENCRQQLLAARSQRVRPGLDDKILTSWNALMLKGYVMAWRITQNDSYLKAALQNARFLETELLQADGSLMRSWKAGEARIPAFLEDYALLADAWLALYQATFDTHWLRRAEALVTYAQTYFQDAANGLYWYTDDRSDALIARKKELYDNVIPSSNAVLAHTLLSLGHITGKAAWVTQAREMAATLRAQTLKYAGAHAHWGSLLLRFAWPQYELAIAGPQAQAARAALDAHYLPQVVLAGTTQPEDAVPLLANRWVADGAVYYVCQGHTCQLPTPDLKQALHQLGVATA